jgi:uncharacterized protein (DUF433 family)
MELEKGVLGIFSAGQVSRLTGLSSKQLRYWDDTEFFRPTYIGRAHTPFNRVYTFQDVVGLRAISIMRKDQQVPLPELRRVGAWLAANRGSWSGTTFYVGGKRVYWDEQPGGLRIGTRPEGQAVMQLAMDEIHADMQASIARLRRRQPEQLGHIEKRRYIASNKPVIAGTRISTEAIRRLSEAGYDREAIRREYPQLTDLDIDVALEWEASQRAG